jgi:acyl CoA:acetate/3-ketoacid CoA transferase
MYDYVSEEMPEELVLSELARGIDLRRDILDRMQFSPARILDRMPFMRDELFVKEDFPLSTAEFTPRSSSGVCLAQRRRTSVAPPTEE